MRQPLFFRAPSIKETGHSSMNALTEQIQPERIAIIDTVRGVALLGILLININFFALPFWMGSNLNVRMV